MLSKEELSDKYYFPAYSSVSTNNGIIGYTNSPEFICDETHPVFVTFGDHTRTFNIATKSFSVLDNVKVLLPCVNDYRLLLWIITAWQKNIPNLGYARHWKKAKNCVISLPTKNGEIDFEFMESFVAELEAQRVEELEAYLLATGLKDFELTDKEKQAIDDIDKIQWKEFYLIDVFNVKNTKNILSTQVEFNSGNTPYLCASSDNNGVASYITFNDLYIDKGNCIFIGGKTFAVSYQKEDFYSNDSHNLALYLICEDMITEKNQLYMATCIKKGLGHKYSWGNSISNGKIQTDTIMLPVHDKHVDYVYMETLISAIQKLVIKDVVLYADRKIEATRQVVER